MLPGKWGIIYSYIRETFHALQSLAVFKKFFIALWGDLMEMWTKFLLQPPMPGLEYSIIPHSVSFLVDNNYRRRARRPKNQPNQEVFARWLFDSSLVWWARFLLRETKWFYLYSLWWILGIIRGVYEISRVFPQIVYSNKLPRHQYVSMVYLFHQVNITNLCIVIGWFNPWKAFRALLLTYSTT